MRLEEEEKKNNEEKKRKSERVVVLVLVLMLVVESERWSTLKGGNKTGGGMTVPVLHMPLQVGTHV